MATDNPQPGESSSTMSDSICLFVWLGLGLISGLILIISAVHAPARIKLLGLFSIGFGLMLGSWLSFLAQKCFSDLHLTDHWRGKTLLAGALIVAAIAGIGLESHRLWKRDLLRSREEDRRRVATMSLAGSQLLEQERATWERIDRDDTRFSEFLKRRTQTLQLGTVSSVSIWLLEILIGGVAGTWLFSRTVDRQEKPETTVGE